MFLPNGKNPYRKHNPDFKKRKLKNEKNQKKETLFDRFFKKKGKTVSFTGKMRIRIRAGENEGIPARIIVKDFFQYMHIGGCIRFGKNRPFLTENELFSEKPISRETI